jgi:transcriptional regulator with XRE-family HTH domain
MGTGDMTLTQYREKYGVSFAHIARAAGVTAQAVSAYARGESKPSWMVAGLIEKCTLGKVERAQWYQEDKPKGGGNAPE